MKKVAVTGGAGFIGSHLVDRLLKEGNDVLVLDNLSTGHPKNLSAHKDNNKLQLVERDIADFQGIKDHFKDVTWVFHLAALADIVPSIQDPLKYHASNVEGTVSVLEAARQAGVKRFLYTASSSCYGIPEKCPTPETSNTRKKTKSCKAGFVRYFNRIIALTALPPESGPNFYGKTGSYWISKNKLL